MASSNSSKTAHVMNLLSKNRGGAPAPEPEAPAEKTKPAEPAEQVETVEKPSPVAPIISSINADAAVSNQIKDALEAELTEDSPAPPQTPQEKAAPPRPAEPAPPSAEELMDLPPIRPAEEPAKAPAKVPAETPPEAPAEECYVNVMQLLVEEKAEKYMRMFGVCCCERCQLDVKAFALNHLPPKYVFMGPDERVPRLTVYEAQYSSDITAQLLKACTIVHETPHHTRPSL